MCIYREKNTLCVSGISCLSGYGFARCEKQLLLFHCCSKFGQSWNCDVQKWVNFNLCLFLGERGTACLCLSLSTWRDLHSSSLNHWSACCCSVSCWLQQIARGKIWQVDLSKNLVEDFSLIVYYIAFPDQCSCGSDWAPDVAGRRSTWAERMETLEFLSLMQNISALRFCLFFLRRSALYLLG